MKVLTKEFFERKPELVASDLLGKLLVRQNGYKYQVGIIVETEAYLGNKDKASHSYSGETKRNKPMFGPAGYTYVYFTYGMHWLLNIVTEKEGQPSAVLIRAVEPLVDDSNIISNLEISELRKMGSGPARLTKWMNIDGNLNSLDVSRGQNVWVADEIQVKSEKIIAHKINLEKIITTKRIGIEGAKEARDLPLRFYLKDNQLISKI